MVLIEQVADGYALRRNDEPDAPPLIVSLDELADAVATLFEAGTLADYVGWWDQEVATAPAACVA